MSDYLAKQGDGYGVYLGMNGLQIKTKTHLHICPSKSKQSGFIQAGLGETFGEI